MIDYARSAEGAPLATFLEGITTHQDEAACEHLRHWREQPGYRPSYYEVDHVVTRLRLHVWLLPDRFWTRRVPTDPPYTPPQRPPISSLPTTCAHCGGPVVRKHGNRSRYCTPTCASHARHAHANALAALDMKVCEGCGNTFTRADVGLGREAWALRRFCTANCRRKLGTRRKQMVMA